MQAQNQHIQRHKIWEQLNQQQQQRILTLLAQLVLRQLGAETQEARHAPTNKNN